MSLTIFAGICLWCCALLELTESVVVPSGRCNFNRDLNTVDCDYRKLAEDSPLRIHYFTQFDNADNIDRARILILKNRQGQLYSAISAYSREVGIPRCTTYTQEVISSGVIKETGIDDNGQTVDFKIYILANMGNATLYYRCCETETATTVDVDTRFIVSPVHKQVTIESLDKLKEIDKKFSFAGEWLEVELP